MSKPLDPVLLDAAKVAAKLAALASWVIVSDGLRRYLGDPGPEVVDGDAMPDPLLLSPAYELLGGTSMSEPGRIARFVTATPLEMFPSARSIVVRPRTLMKLSQLGPDDLDTIAELVRQGEEMRANARTQQRAARAGIVSPHGTPL